MKATSRPPQVKFTSFKVRTSTVGTLAYEFKLPFARRFEGENKPQFQVRAERDFKMVLEFGRDHGHVGVSGLLLDTKGDDSTIHGRVAGPRKACAQAVIWLRDWCRYSMAVRAKIEKKKVTPRGTPVRRPCQNVVRHHGVRPPLRIVTPD